jgi:hypothetical protein
MGLKPLINLNSTDPFTEVNGNCKCHFQRCINKIAVGFNRRTQVI